MAKLREQFEVAVPLSVVQTIFNVAINHWVENIQNQTSAFAKTLIAGTAAAHFQKGNTYAGALGQALAKGQGARHPTTTSARVSIPASATTYGGEMIVTAASASGAATTITIDGKTQGWLAGTLRDNVTSLSAYLKEVLPEFASQAQSQKQTNAGPGNMASEIERLSELHKAGVLSELEFAQAKKKIIAG